MKTNGFDRTRGTSGFTLLEVMVATALIAIVFVAVINLYLQTISMSQSDAFHTLAPQLAQQVSAAVDMDLLSGDILEDSGNFGADFPGYTWQVSAETVKTDLLGPFSENLKAIDLTVAYNSDEFIYRLRLYRFIQE